MTGKPDKGTFTANIGPERKTRFKAIASATGLTMTDVVETTVDTLHSQLQAIEAEARTRGEEMPKVEIIARLRPARKVTTAA